MNTVATPSEIDTSELDKLRGLDPVNRRHLLRWIRELQIRKLSARTINTKLWKTYEFLKFLDFKDVSTVTREDFENYLLARDKTCSPFTVRGDFVEVKTLLQFVLPARQYKGIAAIKRQRPKRALPMQVLTTDDIPKLVSACETQRDRALVLTFWDTGARLNEVLGMSIGDVAFDKYGAVAVITGKTGARRARLIAAVPDLQRWIEMHPHRNDMKAPLFLTRTKYGLGNKRMDERTAQNLMTHLGKLAGIGKPTNPHAIRHSRMTDLAKQGLNEAQLRIIAGWSPDSTMPSVYLHLSGADVDEKLLQVNGIKTREDQQPENRLEPRICPRCGWKNPYDLMNCEKCSQALTIQAAMKQEETMRAIEGKIPTLTPADIDAIAARLEERRKK